MINGLQELGVHEQSEINGGESLWYYIGYYVGRAANYIDGDC